MASSQGKAAVRDAVELESHVLDQGLKELQTERDPNARPVLTAQWPSAACASWALVSVTCVPMDSLSTSFSFGVENGVAKRLGLVHD